VKKALYYLSVSALVLSLIVTAGCGGGSTSVQAQTTTMGQELTDLKKAYDSGVITEKEYEKSKAKILKRYN
jgi:uncharacterized membrane protein